MGESIALTWTPLSALVRATKLPKRSKGGVVVKKPSDVLLASMGTCHCLTVLAS